MFKYLNLFAITFLFGCGTYAVPGQQQAVNIIWYQTYHETKKPPDILWLDQNSLNCAKGKYGNYEGWNDGYQCVAGETYIEIWSVAVSHSDDPDWQIHKWALAHEYWHAALFLNTGDADIYHKDPGFWSNDGAVYKANAALEKAGL